MCKGIEELIEMGKAEGKEEGKKEGKAEGKAEGILITLVQLVRDGLLELSVAAERANISKESFTTLLANENSEKICIRKNEIA